MKTALVIGSATGVWEEIFELRSWFRPDEVVVVNDMIQAYRYPITAAVSLHPEKMSRWLSQRMRRSHQGPQHIAIQDTWEDWFRVIRHEKRLSFTPTLITGQMMPGQTNSGSSGLFAVKVALDDLCCDRVICVGMPMDADRAHFHRAGREWRGADRHRKGWEEARDHMKGRVTSMSGWTADFLGKPSPAWLVCGDQTNAANRLDQIPDQACLR